MTKTINVGVIGSLTVDSFPEVNTLKNGFNLKKILSQDNISADHARSKYPSAQIVNDIDEIVSDNSIELVIVSDNNRPDSAVIEKILQSGKHIRVI